MSDPKLHVAGPDDAPKWIGEPWARQPKESSKAFRAFQIYRDAGVDRCFPDVLEALGKTRGYTRQLETWSSVWRWVARVRLYDDHLDEIRRAGAAKAIEEMSDRHIRETLEMQRIAMMPAREMMRRIDAGEIDLTEIPALELLKISRLMTYGYTTAARMERLARGVSDRWDGAEDAADAAESERLRMAELHGEAVVQVIILVLGSPELELDPEKQQIARRLAGKHLRELSAAEG